jgi:thiomorpholine-carboxylate dehydrogenase
LFIPEEKVRELLAYDKLIPAIRQALMDYSAGLVDQPARTILRAGNAEGAKNGWFAVMPVVAGEVMAVKTVTFYPGNAESGLPTHMAMIELLSRSTGEPLAVMDGRLITEMRTACVSAVAFAALAPLHFAAPPTTLGILGAGVQAHAHIQALSHVWPQLAEIRIWSRTQANAERLAAAASAQAVSVRTVSARTVSAQAVSIEKTAAADVVLTATSAQQPILQGRWLKPNALVLAVGATGASLRELDDEVMQSSFVVAESRSAVERESGDVRLSGATVSAEIGEILARPQAFAIPRDKRIVFKSVGMAIEDLTGAHLVWQALQRQA